MPVSDYTPDVQKVATNLMSRTRDSYGALAGTFTANTTPTDTQVTAIVGAVITEVADQIGDDIPTPLFDDAKQVVALRAAMQIELDFFSEQVNTGRSIYPQLEKQYMSALMALQKQITLISEGEDATRAGDSGPTNSPSYCFPQATGFGTKRF